ncbi:oligosaccharide flippase family protein, partial [Parabacteroides goldsteinii]
MSSTKKELLSGVFYTAIAKYSGIIISLVIAGILARLIEPEDFGVVAIATVIISFFG